MTEAATASPDKPLGLFARAIGIITSPKATFENIVKFPKAFGILFLCAVLMGVGSAAPQFTPEGQQAVIDMQTRAAAAQGRELSQQQLDGMQRFAPYFAYFTLGSLLIFLPIITLFASALYWALFNIVLGGTASFKQVFAITAHSGIIMAVGILVGLPFTMTSTTMEMGGPFNLGALVPMLEETSLVAKLLAAISVFSIWGAFVNAIGLATLYRRKVTGIFIALLIVQIGFAYIGTLFRG
jgi:hypothetical protein